MDTRALGTSSLQVSVVGLGCNNLGRRGTRTETLDGAHEVVFAALDAGVTFFDTADIYGADFGISEAILGECLHGRRDEAIIATKFGHQDYESPLHHLGPRGGRAYIRASVEGCLARLQTDHIDLHQLHPPGPMAPIPDTLEAPDAPAPGGNVRQSGRSNLAAPPVPAA